MAKDKKSTLSAVGASILYHISGLIKQYRGADDKALDDVNLIIPPGSIFGLLGPNGAGKSTLLSILVGLTPKSAGQIQFDGLDLERHLQTIRAQVGFVPQELAFYPMLTGRENLEFFAEILPCDIQSDPPGKAAQIESCIQVVGLEEHIHKKAKHYSGGLKRRLNLAIGLLNQPKLLCLDEPTVGIDPQSRSLILRAITELNQAGTTIIYTSHYMEEVEQICNHVAIIDGGRIVRQGAIEDMLTEDANTQLSIQFDRALPSSLKTALNKIQAVAVQTDTIAIKTSLPLVALKELAACLQETELEIRQISYGTRRLEDLFFELTGTVRDTADE